MTVCTKCGQRNAADASFCSACGTSLLAATAAPRATRRTVTVLFSDMIDSTPLGERLDPESLRRVMDRYFEVMGAVLTHHGGTVEKYIGDAVMAVFGIPRVHEDDALRAVRAAVEMRERLSALNDELAAEFDVRIETRTGLNTGEVVAGDPSAGQRLVTGDAVNVAARLEKAAEAGEILLGDSTYRLIRDAVEVSRCDALPLKGKTVRVQAVRLERLMLDAAPIARRFATPFVGRERELSLLQQAYSRAVEERACHLFTIVGPAGIGKSRLAQELCTAVESEATVLSGRCLPYGKGITFWPLVEMLEALGNNPHAVELLGNESEGSELVNRAFAAAGLAEGFLTPEESSWAIRKFFEALARSRSLAVVIDDLQWAEPAFLDLVEHIAEWSRDAPMLLLCLARSELLEARPGWGGGKPNATSILLEPLSEIDAERLVDNLLPGHGLTDPARARVAEAAEGNPLFVEQMLAMLTEDERIDNNELTVPPTIQALLAARLDRLPRAEQALIEAGAVVGKVFWRGALAELAPQFEDIDALLQNLVRKELIRPHSSTIFPSDEAFRFRHLLIRDAAYAAIPKDARTDLHERFAEWLQRQSSSHDEIVGYHLEQAAHYRAELRPADKRGRLLAARAAERLSLAGQRALARSDARAAVTLLDRAVALLDPSEPDRVKLLPELGRALCESGDLDRAEAVLDDAIEWAHGTNDRLEARALVWKLNVAVQRGTSIEECLAQTNRAIAILERVDDDVGLAQALLFAGKLELWLGRSGAAADSFERALTCARRAGDRREEIETFSWLLVGLLFGSTPVTEAIERCNEIAKRAHGEPQLEAFALITRAGLDAMHGRTDDARATAARGRELLQDLGARLAWAGAAIVAGSIELVGGNAKAAERVLRPAYELFEQIGETGYLSTLAAYLAEALYGQGRDDEADHFTSASEEAAAPDDFEAQASWRAVRAKVRARGGDLEEAERLAREAVEIAAQTDYLDLRGRALISLVEVLQLGGRSGDAIRVADEAIDVFERKGNIIMAQRVRELLCGYQ